MLWRFGHLSNRELCERICTNGADTEKACCSIIVADDLEDAGAVSFQASVDTYYPYRNAFLLLSEEG